MLRYLSAICTLFVRLTLGFWVGGAVLFVITSVAEQTSPLFDSVARDRLATIRFPLYYLFCWICLGTALVSSVLGFACASGCLRKRLRAAAILVLISLGIAVADYFWVYRPLQALIIPPGEARTQEFVTLHNRSRHINELHLTIALVAAVVICLPEKGRAPCSPAAD
ncbi:MAG: hypothetical protein JNM43_13565 [Planctomycetaceae bacterium]|nr:hypothetical protein [Planctomycetaceae bacterium]